MGINANSTFAGQFGTTFGEQSNNARANRKDAMIWLNVGYQTTTTNAEGDEETIFISLPYGIPLDTQETYDLSKVKNANMRKLRTAQNALFEQVMDAAKSLNAGEDILLAADPKTGLCVQLRRVAAEAAETASDDDRALVKPLKLVA